MRKIHPIYQPKTNFEFIRKNRKISITTQKDKVTSWRRYRLNPDIIEKQYVKTNDLTGIAEYDSIGNIEKITLIRRPKKIEEGKLKIQKIILDYINKTRTIANKFLKKSPKGRYLIQETRPNKFPFSYGKSRLETQFIQELERRKLSYNP